MKIFMLFMALASLPMAAQAAPAGERLGKVSFPVSCSPSARAPFNRGVALLHDFWYDEAQPQFERIAKLDPQCAMAHWGIAMSQFHQIWDRPDEHGMARGRAEMQAARAHPAKTAREREYVAALSGFFQPDKRDYQARIDEYAAAMGRLYGHYPHDLDAGTFYALSLLAAEAPDDTSLTQEHRAMAVLSPLFVKYPDHPGVVHYVIHACDTPSRAGWIACGQALRRDRRVGSPCRAHAGTYLCAAWHVAGRHRRQSCLGGGVASGRRTAPERSHGSVSLGRLPALCLSAKRQRRRSQSGHGGCGGGPRSLRGHAEHGRSLHDRHVSLLPHGD